MGDEKLQPTDEISESDRKSSIPAPGRAEQGPKILFALDPVDRYKEITTLPLTRTFSRNSYSSARDEVEARVKRATRSKDIEPQTILPIGSFCDLVRADDEDTER